ncbi:hypothetical protein GcC1_114003 [Golovinomyces cichoracearum]|uniref:Large ribosomal subunit protein mL54 n=1 Tax=Golovinomyces cichoracearum TaxID=62708 RepID=A0A420I8C6_9PEZI|nr:hypothetical protein GcC1_114003 [Golovinomyces cichoracearum]
MTCTRYFFNIKTGPPFFPPISRRFSLSNAASHAVAPPLSNATNLNPKSHPDGPVSAEKPTFTFPVSISPAGTVLRGLNYIKGRDDPVAMKEDDYPIWLWKLLDEKKSDKSVNNEDSDLFSKSKKLRKKAAKKQRKLDAIKKASGKIDEVQIPLTQQSIDLPSNENGSWVGASVAEEGRNELRAAMRVERRKGIKEKNYLKSV